MILNTSLVKEKGHNENKQTNKNLEENTNENTFIKNYDTLQKWCFNKIDSLKYTRKKLNT